MTYRDESDSIIEELRQTKADLAKVNTELREREARDAQAISYKNEYGNPRPWVLIAIGSIAVGIVASWQAFHQSQSDAVRGFYAVGMISSACWAMYLIWKILPREKTK